MAITWKVLGQQVLGAAAAAVYTAPTATSASVTAAQAWNPGAAAVVVDVFLAPPLGTAADATHIERVSVPAASAATLYGVINQKIIPGAAIYAIGAGVTMTVSGAESV